MPSVHEHITHSLSNCGFSEEDLFVLACSGGRDSMLLLHALQEVKLNFVVAHVNFQLRGAESDGDEAFIAKACKDLNLSFHATRVQTQNEVSSSGESTQMVARRLRYDWLNALVQKLGAKRIITAHHQRDQAETILLNLMRGTGHKGLQAMLPDNGQVWRPMLDIAHADIVQEAIRRNLAFREDKSNAEKKYKRNFLRHALLTPWEERYPGTQRQLGRSAELMRESNAFMEEQLEKEASNYMVLNTEGQLEGVKQSICEHAHARLLMRHILRDTGLLNEVPYILEKTSGPGALFASETHKLLVDREVFWIEERIKESVKQTLIIQPDESLEWGRYSLNFAEAETVNQVQVANGTWIPQDIKLPLKVRSWLTGDRMQPFGMNGSKLLSDLFTDAKWSVFQKEKAAVICDADGTIIYVPGLRSAEQNRVEPGDIAYALTYKEL